MVWSILLRASCGASLRRSGTVLFAAVVMLLVAAPRAHAQMLPDETRGYVPRACGFDMDNDGIVGEPEDDCNVCDGVTADPDGDGVKEDLIYVDCNSGNDSTGSGTPANPYRTVRKALAMADGPADGAEDIVCARATCSPANGSQLAAQDIAVSGVPNKGPGGSWSYTRPRRGPEERDFRYPANPVMVVGWDTDDDGVYPPFDTNQPEPLVFDACSDANCTGTKTAIGFNPRSNSSYIELAHFTMRNYGRGVLNPAGSISFIRHSGGVKTGLFIHDLVIEKDSYRMSGATDRAAIYTMARFEWLSFENVKVQDHAGWPVRGGMGYGNYIRFRNFEIFGPKPPAEGPGLPLRVWAFRYGEFLGLKYDSDVRNIGAYTGALDAVSLSVATRDVVFRNNEYRNCLQCLEVNFRSILEGGDSMENILLDRQIFLHETPLQGNAYWISVAARSEDGVERGGASDKGTDPNCTEGIGLRNLTLRNSVFLSTAAGLAEPLRFKVGSNCANANFGGVITVENNTFAIANPGYGAVVNIGRHNGRYDFDYKYYAQSYRFRNNTFAGLDSRRVFSLQHKGGDGYYGDSRYPTDFVATGNSYGGTYTFERDGIKYSSLSAWQSGTGYDSGSSACATAFASDGYHLAATDGCSKNKGENAYCAIADFDGRARARSAADPCDRGADEEGNGGAVAPSPEPTPLAAPVLREAAPMP